MQRFTFLLIATTLVWLLMCVPLAILASWLLNSSVISAVILASICAIPITFVMWITVQSATSPFKWPALQFAGLSTVLISVLLITLPLHLLLEATVVGVIALALWAGAGIYAGWRANTIVNVPLTIKSEKLKSPLKLVQLSDVHAGSRSTKFIDKVVEQTLSHQPDAVLITGDLVDSSIVDAAFLSPLAKLTCPVWMCVGNHERYIDLEAAVSAIKQQNITVLRNESADFNGIQIIGVDDTDNPRQAATQLSATPIATDRYSILLYHRPDGWPAARAAGIDLTLAGHTHAGQIWPFGFMVRRQFPQMSGYFSEGRQVMFVSQGTGTWGPTLRLGTQCEMTVIELKPS